MNLNWFKRKGLYFIPVSIPGWIILACAIIYAVYTGVQLNSSQHSVSDFLMNLVFSLLIIMAIYSLIAYVVMSIHNRGIK